MARILLIEDNNDIQEILYSLLSEDHEVLQAFSGTEGLRLFQQESVDLVLLDIMLPGKNGDQVLEEIRLQSQVPIIMMTALGDKHLISQYLLAGANDYIVKPFNLFDADSQSRRMQGRYVRRTSGRSKRIRCICCRSGCRTVRFLQSGNDHECNCHVPRESGADKRRDQGISCGKSLQMFRI